METTIQSVSLGHGYTGEVVLSVRDGKLNVRLPSIRGGEFGNYRTGGFERAYSPFLNPILPAMKRALARRFGGRKAAAILSEWQKRWEGR